MPLVHPGYCAMLAVVMVQRHHNWVALIGRFLPFGSLHGVFWYHEASPQEGSFEVRPSLSTLGSMSKVHSYLSNIFYFWETTKGSIRSHSCFGSF